MNARGVAVRRLDGERSRRRLAELGLLRTDLAIRSEGEFLLLPLLPGDVPSDIGPIGDHDFDEIPPTGPTDYRDLLAWPPALAELLPRSFDVIGDIVLVRIPPALESRSGEIGAALLRFVPGVRIVGADRGVHGGARQREIVRLAGRGDWKTRHRENGVEFAIDLARAYFSPRLAREHARVAAEVRPGDRVYDLCCGVGPFALTIARDGRARHVTAVDSNPAAIELLQESLQRAGGAERVEAVVSDVTAFARAAPPVERVILNLPLEGIKYLPSVARTVAPSGRLYYYEVTPRSEIERRGETIVRSLDRPKEWTVLAPRVVHPYSPVADLAALSFQRSAPEAPGP